MTNAVVEAILRRRSHRLGFTGECVSDEDLQTIVMCGLAAPSSKDARPWKLHVVRDAATLGGISRLVTKAPDIADYVPHDPGTGRPRTDYRSSVVESANVLQAADAAIFVENKGVFGRGRQGLLEARADRLAGSLMGYTLEVVGIGAAVENMWLAAGSLGLAAAFMGDIAIAEESIGPLLGFEGDLVGALAVGHALNSGWSKTPPRPCSSSVTWHDGTAVPHPEYRNGAT